jgi:hypothetical protein
MMFCSWIINIGDTVDNYCFKNALKPYIVEDEFEQMAVLVVIQEFWKQKFQA